MAREWSVGDILAMKETFMSKGKGEGCAGMLRASYRELTEEEGAFRRGAGDGLEEVS